MILKSKFNARALDALKATGRGYSVVEPNGDGLIFRVSAKGKKSWSYLYYYKGRRKRIPYGSYPEMTIKKARAKHLAARKLVLEEKDPAKEEDRARRARKRVTTVEQLASAFLENFEQRVERGKRKASTLREYKRYLEKKIVPKWRNELASDITTDDIRATLDAIADKGHLVMANRARAYLHAMFSFGMKREILDVNPCARVEIPGREQPGERALTFKEIPVFWAGLEKEGGRFSPGSRLALRLLLATAQRSTRWAVLGGRILISKRDGGPSRGP